MMANRIAIFGMGYVGCVTAACLARDGHQVIGVDVDSSKVDELNSGKSPILEPGLQELIARTVREGTLRNTLDVDSAVRDSDIALITVGTPSRDDGGIELDSIRSVLKAIGSSVRKTAKEYDVVVRSTLLPNVLEEQLAPLLEQASGRPLGKSISLCNNPEFLREGSAIRDYDDPPFIVVGADNPQAAARVMQMYSGVKADQIVTDTRTAALVKYACNAFHALKISFANEIGCLARSFGSNGHEVMNIVCRDSKLNISSAYMRPGFAFGGSCLPKDLRAIQRHAEHSALRLGLLASILPSNDTHVQRALKLITDSGNRSITLLGLGFKANTDDLRESPLVIMVETLLGRGYKVRIYDPNVAVSRLRGRNLAYVDRILPHLATLLVSDATALFDSSSLLLIGTDVADATQWSTEHTGPVIDLRRDLALPADPVQPVRTRLTA